MTIHYDSGATSLHFSVECADTLNELSWRTKQRLEPLQTRPHAELLAALVLTTTTIKRTILPRSTTVPVRIITMISIGSAPAYDNFVAGTQTFYLVRDPTRPEVRHSLIRYGPQGFRGGIFVRHPFGADRFRWWGYTRRRSSGTTVKIRLYRIPAGNTWDGYRHEDGQLRCPNVIVGRSYGHLIADIRY